MRITFLGATKTVTGSKYLLTLGNKNILVDCGLFQGIKELRTRNWTTFPVDPRSIDAVILTHAHVDHSGYLPVLVKNGFTGPIYCSSATKDLCSVLLPDSGFLQEEEARTANKYGYSKHKPALPLYTMTEALATLKQFKEVEFRKYKKVDEETYFSLIPAGHILGASFVEFKHFGTTLTFSGDLGRPDDPIMYAPSVLQAADYLVLEATYGNRLHEKINPLDELEDVINTTFLRNGTVLIPSFAVGRAQHILYLLYQLKMTQRIPHIPIYIDSPMAKSATDIFCKYNKLHRLSAELSTKICDMPTYVNTREESKLLDLDPAPKIIISASGMLEGGRVLHHIRHFGPDKRSTILFTGYQAAGTRGADILNGKKHIKMFGEMIPINAEVKLLSNMSAHADYEEILQWLSHFNHPPRKVFITHGEIEAANALKDKIEERFGWECVVPDYIYSELV